jgi:hypothetical protein
MCEAVFLCSVSVLCELCVTFPLAASAKRHACQPLSMPGSARIAWHPYRPHLFDNDG